MSKEMYRLVTRSDFDGVVCATLLKEMNLIDEIKFVHPKDMQDGKIDITDRDITTNLPYTPAAHLVFDHHHSEALREGEMFSNYVLSPEAPSTARVVYEHFGGALTFPEHFEELVLACDKADSAQFTIDEVLRPSGWVLFNFLMDPRTGLGRFRDFTKSNYDLMLMLIDYCKSHTVEEILELPDMQERVELYNAHAKNAREQIARCTTACGPNKNVLVLDLRNEETIWPTNRFMVYALFPSAEISIHVMWGLKQQNTVFAVGKSIINRNSTKDVGEIMLRYGGGGHEAAGTCQVANDKAEQLLQEVISLLA